MSFRHLAICLLLTVLPWTGSSRLAADELPSWTSIGPDGGNVQALAASPALPDLILAGLEQGYGVFRSANRGRNWGAASDTLGRIVFDLAIDARGKAFYAATSRGLLRSTNGGARWVDLEPAPAVYTLVATHPRQAPIVFAVRAGVLLRSTNRGVTREIVQGPVGVAAIAFALSGQRTVVYAGGGNGLWRSTDDGATWTRLSLPVSPPDVQAVAVDPRDPRVLYVGLWHNRRVLLKSLDGGATWTLSQRGLTVPGSAWPVVSDLVVDRTNSSIVYAIAGGALFRSVNGGRNWSRPVSGLPGGTVQTLEMVGYGLLAGTPAGVLLSTDQGLTWKLRVAGLAATSIARLAFDPPEPGQQPGQLYAATTSAGIFKTLHQGRPWLRLEEPANPPIRDFGIGPDVSNTSNANVLYATASGAFSRSTDDGQTWSRPTSIACVGLGRIVVDPREPAHLYVFGNLLGIQGCIEPYRCVFFRSLDAGETLQCIGSAIDFAPVSILAVDPRTSALYAQDQFGILRRSLDNGSTWTSLSPLGGLTSFAASPLVEGTLWAGQLGVRRSRDGGQTWESFSAGLPVNDVVTTLTPDPADAATIYAATRESGVFKSTDAGETWAPAGLWPPGVLSQGGLLVDPEDPAILYAGTQGLGVLRLDQSGI